MMFKEKCLDRPMLDRLLILATTRPDGFTALNDRFRGYPGWQFCISANEHGRVHGIIMDDTFYVIWLDKDHNLYA